jgi:hypothetical protein
VMGRVTRPPPSTCLNLGLSSNRFTNDNSMCTGAFFAQDLNVRSPIQWIVGATFLKNVYS